jgi:hypothetical protein
MTASLPKEVKATISAFLPRLSKPDPQCAKWVRFGAVFMSETANYMSLYVRFLGQPKCPLLIKRC